MAQRRQDETVTVPIPVTDTVRKWSPGRDPQTDEPDQVQEVSYLADVPAEQVKRVKRYEQRWRNAALTIAIGLSVLMGGHDAAPLVMGGLSTIGATAIADSIIGGGTYTAFNNANAYLGVGDSSTAFAVGQTDLQAASNKARIAMDATYPTRAANVITFRATAGPLVANFAWLENAVFNHASAGQMLVRKAVNLGTKASGATWEFTKTVTITAA